MNHLRDSQKVVVFETGSRGDHKATCLLHGCRNCRGAELRTGGRDSEEKFPEIFWTGCVPDKKILYKPSHFHRLPFLRKSTTYTVLISFLYRLYASILP
jgi:hypothetical protein